MIEFQPLKGRAVLALDFVRHRLSNSLEAFKLCLAMGGKRKTKKAEPKKKKSVVPKSFKCPFCNHEGSCEVKLSREAETGAISCRVCGENFQCRISYLSDPVDVFCDWIDELERVRTGDAGAAAGAGLRSTDSGRPVGGAGAAAPSSAAAEADFLAAEDDDS